MISEGVGFAQYSFAGRKARVRAELRQGFGGHDGVIADGLLGWNDRFGAPTSPWLWSTSTRATFAGRDYVQTYFGVTPGQAAATGLGTFAAGGGLVSTGSTRR